MREGYFGGPEVTDTKEGIGGEPGKGYPSVVSRASEGMTPAGIGAMQGDPTGGSGTAAEKGLESGDSTEGSGSDKEPSPATNQ